MICIKNYVTNSLRKERVQGFENDLARVYEEYCQQRTHAHMITVD